MAYVFQVTNEAFIRGVIAAGHASEDDTTTHRGTLVWKAGAAIGHPDGADRAPRIRCRCRAADRQGGDFPAPRQAGPHTWVTLEDPEGNELCVSQ